MTSWNLKPETFGFPTGNRPTKPIWVFGAFRFPHTFARGMINSVLLNDSPIKRVALNDEFPSNLDHDTGFSLCSIHIFFFFSFSFSFFSFSFSFFSFFFLYRFLHRWIFYDRDIQKEYTLQILFPFVTLRNNGGVSRHPVASFRYRNTILFHFDVRTWENDGAKDIGAKSYRPSLQNPRYSVKFPPYLLPLFFSHSSITFDIRNKQSLLYNALDIVYARSCALRTRLSIYQNSSLRAKR